MAIENGIAKAAAEAVLEDEIDDNEVENESEDNKEKKKQRRARYFIPSRLEFRQDRIREQQERTVMVGPTTLADLASKKLMDAIKLSTQFFIRFFNQQNDQTNGSEPYKGHIEIRFDTVAEADKCVASLQKLRKGISVKRITPEYVNDQEYKELRQIGNSQDEASSSQPGSKPVQKTDRQSGTGQRAARMVAITGLNPGVTCSMISEVFPKCTNVSIPKAYNVENPDAIKGYAYIEFDNVEDAKKLENTKVQIGEQEHKVHLLLEIPNIENVFRRIEKEKIADIPRVGTLEPAKRERLRLLLRYLSHYERINDLPEEKLALIKSKYNLVRKRLKVDYRREAATKRGGAKAGAKGRSGGRGGRGRNLRGYGGGFMAMRGRAAMYGMINSPMMQQRPLSTRGYNGYQDPYDFDFGYDEYGYDDGFGYNDRRFAAYPYGGAGDFKRMPANGFRGANSRGKMSARGRGSAGVGYYGGRRW